MPGPYQHESRSPKPHLPKILKPYSRRPSPSKIAGAPAGAAAAESAVPAAAKASTSLPLLSKECRNGRPSGKRSSVLVLGSVERLLQGLHSFLPEASYCIIAVCDLEYFCYGQKT